MRRSKRRKSEKHALSGILRLLCAEQHVGNLKKKYTFRKSGTPVRRTKRRKSQKKIHFQVIWDSCAQNKTSEISKNGLSGVLGLLCAEQSVGNLKKQSVGNLKNALSGILGLLCAEQDVGNLKKCTFKNSGTPVRTTRSRGRAGAKLGAKLAATVTSRAGRAVGEAGGEAGGKAGGKAWGNGNFKVGQDFGNSFQPGKNPIMLRMFGE